jgi:hypothetical protein
LNQTLIGGKNYQLACKLRPSKNYRSADAIDFYFSKDSLYSLDSGFFHVTPQVSNPSGNIISDSLHWYILVDTFTAAGDEQYLTIGSFRSGAVTNTLPGSSADPRAYMFIDSVSVVLLDTLSVLNANNDLLFSIYPNPSNGYLNLNLKESNHENISIQLSDVYGKLVHREKLQQGKLQHVFDFTQLANGVYCFTVLQNNTLLKTQKLILQRE